MKIEEVLQIKEQMMGDYSVQAVDGQSLHEALEIKSRFRDWMPSKLIESGAVLGKDYTREMRENDRGPNSLVFTLTLATAKDVAMLSRGVAAQKVRDYFKACEKAVQTATQSVIEADKYGTNPNKRLMQELTLRMDVLKLVVGDDIPDGVRIAVACQSQNIVAQETGVTVDLPKFITDRIVDTQAVTFDSAVDTAFASKVAIGRNYITVSQIAKDFHPLTSTDINTMLVNMGYLKRTGYSTYSVTNKGREFASTRTLQSGPNKGNENVTGWNLDDVRFWGSFKEMLIAQRDLKKKQLASKRNS